MSNEHWVSTDEKRLRKSFEFFESLPFDMYPVSVVVWDLFESLGIRWVLRFDMAWRSLAEDGGVDSSNTELLSRLMRSSSEFWSDRLSTKYCFANSITVGCVFVVPFKGELLLELLPLKASKHWFFIRVKGLLRRSSNLFIMSFCWVWMVLAFQKVFPRKVLFGTGGGGGRGFIGSSSSSVVWSLISTGAIG